MFDLAKRLPLFLAAGAILAAAGCASSPEDRLVGIWTLETSQSRFPKPPVPGMERRFADLKRNFRLKLLADKTLVLTGVGTGEGTWSYREGKLQLTMNDDFARQIFEQADIKVAPDQTRITLVSPTPLGEVRLALRKTG